MRIKKPKKKGIKYWKKKAWEAFSIYIRTRDSVISDCGKLMAECCTCGKVYPAFGKGCIQAGHFIPGRHNSILFDERCVAAQCYFCNVTLKGNWTEYLPWMVEKYGQDVVDELLRMKKQVVKYTALDLEEICEKYKRKTMEID